MTGLPRETYHQIVNDLDIPVMSCAHIGLLANKYPGVHSSTICAILSQETQYKVVKNHHIHKANMATYCSRYICGEDVLDICAGVDFPPCLMMRRMLELMLKLSKQRVSDVLKDASMLTQLDRLSFLQDWIAANTSQQPHQPKPQQHKQQQQQKARDLQHVQAQLVDAAALLQRLQVDIVRCVHADSSYSPYCDMAKSLAGLEHEAKLYAQLQAADIPFWTEQQLRQKGLFKTPDALLQVPICVRAGPADRWHIIHWIDSKASFGDERTHSSQLEGQYRTYINRYGPGLVIYWFGFLAGMENDEEVVMLDDFPATQDTLQLPRLQLPQLNVSPLQPAGAADVLHSRKTAAESGNDSTAAVAVACAQ